MECGNIPDVPFNYARSLLGHARNPRANRHLGVALAFVAGAINAGGFLAVHRYTAHLTGIVTDIGIELGRMAYWNRDPAQPKVAANRARLRLLLSLLAIAPALDDLRRPAPR